ncbi:MAG: pilus assembly protein [Gammaproteobacteria bacterium]|nr:pilus assembly protein [Gammaproteobacteria bacterium]
MRAMQGSRERQRGAAAIEFALIFIPMFALFYALVSYGLIMALMQGMTLAAEEGARAAIAVDRSAFASTDEYMNTVRPRVRDQVGLSLAWLPDSLKTHVLGDGNENVGVQLSGDVLQVQVRYANYADAPLIPTLVLPGIGPVPRVGTELLAQASINL